MASNLIEALEEWMAQQSALVALFSSGGIYNSDSPPTAGDPLPALTFTQKTSRITNIIGGGSIQYLQVDVEVQAVYAEDARRLTDRAKEILLGGSSLTWAGGREVGRYETDGEGGELQVGIGFEGSDVWLQRIPLIFCTVRD